VTSLALRDCSTCGEQRAFEAPVCADGHEADCPELACVDCGEAVFVGAFGVEGDTETGVGQHVAAAA